MAYKAKFRRDMGVKFKNTELCRLTEQVIFTDPYYSAPVNRHTSPQLDKWAQDIQNDVQAKASAARLKVNAHPPPLPTLPLCFSPRPFFLLLILLSHPSLVAIHTCPIHPLHNGDTSVKDDQGSIRDI